MKNFNDIYINVLKNSKDKLEKIRKDNLSITKRIVLGYSVIFIIIIIATWYVHKLDEWFAYLMMIFVCSVITFTIWIEKKIEIQKMIYYYAYKENVIKVFVKAYDENLEYCTEKIIPEDIYRMGFYDSCSTYSSEDIIEGNIDNHEFIMGEVHTKRKRDNVEEMGTIFHGMFGNVKINNKYNGRIQIRSNEMTLGKLLKDDERIEMDSAEFEKYFDVYADDSIQTMQVLTSDIMEMMIDFIKESDIKFEITITQNNFYIRFKTGSIFEANKLKSSVDFDTLKEVFDIINFTFNITRALVKVTEETEI